MLFRSYIRNINIYGNDKTRENVIRRELDVFPGDLFRRTLLQRSMRKLNVLNYFDPTSLSPNVVPVDEDEIDLDITLAEKSSDKARDRKSTRLNSSHALISYAVFCLKKKKNTTKQKKTKKIK